MKKLTLFLGAISAIILGCNERSGVMLQPDAEAPGEGKPEDPCGLYVNVANPGEYLELRKDGTFYLKEEFKPRGVHPIFSWSRTLNGKWRIATEDGTNVLIMDNIITVALTAGEIGLPPGEYGVLRGVIEDGRISGLRPPVSRGSPPETIWVKRGARRKP